MTDVIDMQKALRVIAENSVDINKDITYNIDSNGVVNISFGIGNIIDLVKNEYATYDSLNEKWVYPEIDDERSFMERILINLFERDEDGTSKFEETILYITENF